MPLAICSAIRQTILRRHARGQSSAVIAQALQLNQRTVRHLLRRIAIEGEAALFPSYDACGPSRNPDQQAMHAQAVRLREQHQRWGAGRIRIELAKLFPHGQVPCERTL